jgi:hypothetical protein
VYHHYVAVTILTVIALVCLRLVVRFGRRSWWALVAAAISLPTIIVVALGSALPGPNWTPTQFILDVVVPLAVLGLLAATIGSALGAMLRWLLRRRTI